MELSKLTFIVTDQCNFNCTYCYQKKEHKTMDNATVETAVDFFYPHLTNLKDVRVGFYGGEPLLAYDRIVHAVELLLEKNKAGNKKISFFVTTNGSLLTEEKLDFFNRNKFSLMLSFDGLAQDKGRKEGTLEQTVDLMKRIRDYPGIAFEINSVFTPGTIGDFFDSLRFIIEQGGTDITFNISTMEEWGPRDLAKLESELERLTEYMVLFYRKNGKVPVKNFNAPGSGIFHCNAGCEHMAVSPGGELWGCFLFHDYFKTRKDDPQYPDYFVGALARFAGDEGLPTDYPGIKANYSQLRQDFFQVEGKEKTFCFLCEDVQGCMVCPVNAAYSSGSLGKISCLNCRLVKMQAKARKNFFQEMQSTDFSREDTRRNAN